MIRTLALLVVPAALAVTGCAQSGVPTTQSTPTAAGPITAAKRERPVVAGRPARVYVFAGFDETTCAPVQMQLAADIPPQKGTVEFRPNQATTITESASGKCVGAQIAGTGVYYTARPDASGSDRFTVSATTASGQGQSKVFDVKIAR
ncbi:MAG: hypothetical protein AAFQ45_04055 [Pseudomonadota bacterium]